MPAQAAAAARDGDMVLIDAGSYPDGGAVWQVSQLTIVGVGGRVTMRVSGRLPEGKAIWVVRGKQVTIRGIEFVGARNSDRNGAGIRFEFGSLSLADCSYFDNENGVLTGNDGMSSLAVMQCEFGSNGHGDGYSHNLYVGRLARLRVEGCYLHGARVGHLLKSRAAENEVRYNCLVDSAEGRASYELEFPDGGLAHVVGNIIGQATGSSNSTLISYGAEGRVWTRNSLHLVNNTLIDPTAGGGRFVVVWPIGSKVVLFNNLLVGKGEIVVPSADSTANQVATLADFADAKLGDWRLRDSSAAVALWQSRSSVGANVPLPHRQYLHPLQTIPIDNAGLLPGAIQRVAASS